MPDYSTGKVYTIRCRTDDTLIYVGSTIQSLAVRWGSHKKNSEYKKNKNRLIYATINNDWSNWFIELYEEYPCENREQLNRREGEIIREIGTLNYQIAGRTTKERCEDNKEKIAEQKKIYNETNKEKLKEYQKGYYKQNREKRLNHAKEYNEKNKDKLLDYAKEYYEANKEKKLDYAKEYYKNNKEKKNIE